MRPGPAQRSPAERTRLRQQAKLGGFATLACLLAWLPAPKDVRMSHMSQPGGRLAAAPCSWEPGGPASAAKAAKAQRA
jgi:hypothetical protein